MKSLSRAGCFFLILILSRSFAFSQSRLPVIKASSMQVAINDGGDLNKNAWRLSPQTRPDVFTAERTRETKWVSFITDQDSIRIKVKPGTRYDFIILLNGKDSCYTRVLSAIPPEDKQKKKVITHDTIPFTLTEFNAICVKAVINTTDTLNLHFDVGSFDFRLTKDAILKKTGLLSNQPEALAGKVKPDYGRLNPVKTLKLGSIVWEDPYILPTGFTAHDMDGRFGWNLFEGKQVELNYDCHKIIVHSRLPEASKTYTRSGLKFIRSFVCVSAAFKVNGKLCKGDFLLDTGSDQAIVLDSSWVAKSGFPKDLRLLKTSVLKDPRGVTYETKIVSAPLLEWSSFSLQHVPAYLLDGRNPTGFEINYLGNDLLKRFNMILDFEKDELYLKPNALMKEKYREAG